MTLISKAVLVDCFRSGLKCVVSCGVLAEILRRWAKRGLWQEFYRVKCFSTQKSKWNDRKATETECVKLNSTQMMKTLQQPHGWDCGWKSPIKGFSSAVGGRMLLANAKLLHHVHWYHKL